MSVPTLPCADVSALVTGNTQQLFRIHDDATNLCVWQRTVAPGLPAYVDRVVDPLTIKREVTAELDRFPVDDLLVDLPAGPGRRLLGEDIGMLLWLYAEITRANTLTVKLQSFSGNLCERFHTDNVPLRLICAYAGPGTEWLANEDVERCLLGSAELPINHPAARIGQMKRFEVGFMKGERWPGNRGRGLVHRSPKVDDGVRRVLLKIEQPADHH